jgi:hypothetical protein
MYTFSDLGDFGDFPIFERLLAYNNVTGLCVPRGNVVTPLNPAPTLKKQCNAKTETMTVNSILEQPRRKQLELLFLAPLLPNRLAKLAIDLGESSSFLLTQ